jgi:glycosyltransferase involved in cell wall biosynthesis
VVNLIQGLCRLAEHQVHVITFKPGLARDQTVRPRENLTIHYLRAPRFSGVATLYLTRIVRLRRLLRRLAPDIVHGQGTEREMGLAAVTSGRPAVITVHGLLFEVVTITRPSPLATIWVNVLIERLTLHLARHVVCISEYARQHLAVRTRARLYLVPNAVSDRFFASGGPMVRDVLLFVGNIYALKGVLELVGVFESLAAENPTLKLVLIGKRFESRGNRPYLAGLDARIQASGLADRIHFAGWQDEASIKAWHARAVLFIFPSRLENLPMSIAEALASGVPVIASDVGGIGEMVQHGVNGYLARPEDTAAFIALARKALEPEENRRLAQSAATSVERFRIGQVAECTLSVYAEMLA